MDARRFDQIARVLSASGARRALLHLLVALPLAGRVALLAEGEVDADGRRRRRKKRHKHGKGRRRRARGRRCNPTSRAKTCAGQCGLVKNNCRKTVDCGSCACDPPCDACFVCDETTGVCEPDPVQVGDDCGEPGQLCEADGSCACDVSSCTLPETCGGGGIPGSCGCTPTTCEAQGKTCGTIPDDCGDTLPCGSCDAALCLACGPNNTCVQAMDDTPCDDDQRCCNGTCTFTDTDLDNCGSCGNDCPVNVGVLCLGGICCQGFSGSLATCSVELPCCAPFTCRTSGSFSGTCCGPSGFVTCFTDNPSFCCNTCIADDPNCVGHCPGRCS